MMAFHKKQRLNSMLACCLACLFFLASCSGSTPVPTTAPTTIPTATLEPTPTSTLIPMSVFTTRKIDGQFPDGFLQYDPDFTDFQSGTYVIGTRNDFDSSGIFYSSIYYMSLNRNLYGNLAIFRQDVLNVLLHNDTDSSYDVSLSTNLEDPEYMNIVAELVPTERKYIDRIDEMVIRSVKLRTREQHIWRATFQTGSKMLCNGVSLSPNHEWVAGNCWKDGENYVYFLNIQQGTVKTLNSLNYPCRSSEYNDTMWWYYNWSPDGQWLSTSCETSNNIYTSCLVSPESEEFSCRPDGYYRPKAWSPDGSKVAVIDPNDDILITDTACLNDAQSCPEYFRSPLTPLSETSEFYGCHVAWDPTSKIVIWSIYANYVGGDGPTAIWVANLESGEIYHIDWAPDTDVYSISPDGKWIVIGDTSWNRWLLSIDGSTSRNIGQDIGTFLGWLVVP